MLHVARFAQVQFGLALLVLLVLLAALAWRNVFGRPPAEDLVLPSWWRTPSLSDRVRRRLRWGLDGGLALAAVALALFSMTAARPSGSGLDRGRVLHEIVQAKYHAELGWDGLYACAWAADQDAEQALLGIQKLRVSKAGPPPKLEPTPVPERNENGRRPRARPKSPPPNIGGRLLPAQATRTRADCRERFDEQRWAELGADLAALAAMNPEQNLAIEFEGFGPTATPARLARQRLTFSLLPFSGGSLFTLSLLAGLLALGALVVVERAYGLRVAALVGIVGFAEFGGSPIAGGATTATALMLALCLAGLAATELDRWALGGALLGLVAVELVWPSLLVLGLLAKFGAEWLAGRPRKRELARFALGVGASAAAVLLFSATLPGGFGNWSSWADQVALSRYADGSREVGLRWLFALDGNYLSAPRWVPYPRKAQNLVDRQGWIMLCGLALLVPSLLAVRRLPAVAFAAIAGVTATFAMFSTSGSAWAIALPLLALAVGAIGKHHPQSAVLIGRPATILVAGCLAICMGMHGIVRIHQYEPWLFNVVYSHLLTTLFLGLGVALIVLPGLREHGDPTGAPASIPCLEPATKAAVKFPRIALLRAWRKRDGGQS